MSSVTSVFSFLLSALFPLLLSSLLSQSPLLRLSHYLRAGPFAIKARLYSRNDTQSSQDSSKGQVFIVGAGPGDAELLTLKAFRLLQTADVVLFDALVSDEVLSLIPNGVAREYVGKRCNKHSASQADICRRVVELALQGKSVVRLKGGDPALFARTSEEAVALEQAGISFAIVPGITAASGVSAYSLNICAG